MFFFVVPISFGTLIFLWSLRVLLVDTPLAAWLWLKGEEDPTSSAYCDKTLRMYLGEEHTKGETGGLHVNTKDRW